MFCGRSWSPSFFILFLGKQRETRKEQRMEDKAVATCKFWKSIPRIKEKRKLTQGIRNQRKRKQNENDCNQTENEIRNSATSRKYAERKKKHCVWEEKNIETEIPTFFRYLKNHNSMHIFTSNWNDLRTLKEHNCETAISGRYHFKLIGHDWYNHEIMKLE